MDILEFQGEYRWLSNFWPVEVILDGLTYPSVENAYQAAKASPPMRETFRQVSPSQAKQLGGQLHLPENWTSDRVQVMVDLIEQKFRPGTDLANKLVLTDPGQLYEGNTWNDTFWGVCNGVGENMLGKILMSQRRKLIIDLSGR